jgi:hypothetical protein
MSRGSGSRTATAYARLREHLAYLGLATASERLAAELERASTETAAPVEVLERLLAAEVEATAARRLSGRLRFAHYPLDKRLGQFEFDFQPSIDRRSSPSSVRSASSRSAATRCSWDHRASGNRTVRLITRSEAGPGAQTGAGSGRG